MTIPNFICIPITQEGSKPPSRWKHCCSASVSSVEPPRRPTRVCSQTDLSQTMERKDNKDCLKGATVSHSSRAQKDEATSMSKKPRKSVTCNRKPELERRRWEDQLEGEDRSMGSSKYTPAIVAWYDDEPNLKKHVLHRTDVNSKYLPRNFVKWHYQQYRHLRLLHWPHEELKEEQHNWRAPHTWDQNLNIRWTKTS